MKIVIKNTPEQQELFLMVIKGDKEAKKQLELYMAKVFEQIINSKKLNKIACDWLCVEELKINVPINLEVMIYNKSLNKIK